MNSIGTQPRPPVIVGIGGTTSSNSSSEKALKTALAHAQILGARVRSFTASEIDFPHYSAAVKNDPRVVELVNAIRDADGLIISTPAYHGAMSGLVKNALDCVEELRLDERPYLDGRAVGLIVCAYGDQAMGTTLSGARSVIHALRGWPTPAAVAINSSQCSFDGNGHCTSEKVDERLRILASQVVQFCQFSNSPHSAV